MPTHNGTAYPKGRSCYPNSVASRREKASDEPRQGTRPDARPHWQEHCPFCAAIYAGLFPSGAVWVGGHDHHWPLLRRGGHYGRGQRGAGDAHVHGGGHSPLRRRDCVHSQGHGGERRGGAEPLRRHHPHVFRRLGRSGHGLAADVLPRHCVGHRHARRGRRRHRGLFEHLFRRRAVHCGL